MNLLIELLTEELPTKAVLDLSDAGKALWQQVLTESALGFERVESFATPRRLAWRIHGIAEKQADQAIEKRGPAINAAKDNEGNWSKAALGFAQSCGVSVEDLIQESHLFYRTTQAGQPLKALLPSLLDKVLEGLPIAKRMRWANHSQSFVRPVLGVVALLDAEVLDLQLFGQQAGRETRGHRVHHPEPVVIQSALSYEEDLRKAYVMVHFHEREQSIREQVLQHAKALSATPMMPEDLVREVASLVEFPVAITGNFEPRFLEVAQEVLIMTMRDNQKTFALLDAEGKMLPHFVAIANLNSQDPDTVIRGNEKVIRPRFADAEFFWQQDLKRPLEAQLPRLEKVVYHEKLGSIADKTRRLEALCGELAPLFGIQAEEAKSAARLSKCDLLSEMVMEFPELQGVMGKYYAAKQGHAASIAQALEEQYQPLGSGAALPQSALGTVLSLAEKLDTLVGGFSIGAKPTGSKDPYALRRMSIAVNRLLIENQISASLHHLLQQSALTFPASLKATEQVKEIVAYGLERLEAQYPSHVYQAVMALHLDDVLDFDARAQALIRFQASDAAVSLLQSAKRIRNILKKNGTREHEVQSALFENEHESALWKHFQALRPELARLLATRDYQSALTLLEGLSAPLDAFFTHVMVMSENADLQNNRLALLSALQAQFDSFADLSLLAG
ncbi:MAG: glycine--tRNA ligase subunit beta [Cardiobacteriaceae bacterium]|nr:glycine--tRNA ligase subunit beta [Cardiobacteriaceae bacterium]